MLVGRSRENPGQYQVTEVEDLGEPLGSTNPAPADARHTISLGSCHDRAEGPDVAPRRPNLRPALDYRCVAVTRSDRPEPGSLVKILVTSASRKVPLLRSIARQACEEDPSASVLAGDADPHCLASYAWSPFVTVPRLTASTDLAPLLTREGVTHLVPTRDGELPWFADHQGDLAAAGVDCLVAAPPSIALCQDKYAFAERLAQSGLPSIPTSLEPIGDARVVVKERHGAGSAGLSLDVDPHTAERAAAFLQSPVFQPFVPGPEISIDAYRARDGRLLGMVARSRDLVLGGESQVSTTIDPTPYWELAEATLEALGLTGPAVLQVIATPQGPRVVECNARLGGASTLSLAIGLDSIRWFVRESAGEDPADLPFRPRPWPTRLIRVSEDLIDDPRP